MTRRHSCRIDGGLLWVHRGDMRGRTAGLGLATLLMAASACSVLQQAERPSPVGTTVVVQQSQPVSQSSTPLPTSATPSTTVRPASSSDGISVEDGKVVVLPTVAGFGAQPVEPTTDTAGVHGSHVLYRNPATGQSFVIGELSGTAVADQLLNPEAHGYQRLTGVSLMGAQAYSKTYGDPATTKWGSIEIAWQLAPDEALLVNGQGMTVDELLAIARSLSLA